MKKNDTDTAGFRTVKTSSQTGLPQDVNVPQKLENCTVPFPSGVVAVYYQRIGKNLDLNVLFDSQSFRTDRKIKNRAECNRLPKRSIISFCRKVYFSKRWDRARLLVCRRNPPAKFSALVLTHILFSQRRPERRSESSAGRDSGGNRAERRPSVSLTKTRTASRFSRYSGNIRLMGKLITSLDKRGAEVVMDVAFMKFQNPIY